MKETWNRGNPRWSEQHGENKKERKRAGRRGGAPLGQEQTNRPNVTVN